MLFSSVLPHFEVNIGFLVDMIRINVFFLRFLLNSIHNSRSEEFFLLVERRARSSPQLARKCFYNYQFLPKKAR